MHSTGGRASGLDRCSLAARRCGMTESRFGMHLVSKVVETSRAGAARSRDTNTPSVLLDHRLDAGRAALSPIQGAPERVEALLVTRRSVRAFVQRSVSARALGRAIDAGVDVDRELW